MMNGYRGVILTTGAANYCPITYQSPEGIFIYLEKDVNIHCYQYTPAAVLQEYKYTIIITSKESCDGSFFKGTATPPPRVFVHTWAASAALLDT